MVSLHLRRRRVSDTDLLDLSPFTRSEEHYHFRELRDHDPIHFTSEANGPGFWSLTRYDHVSSAARDHARFLSGHGTQIQDRRAEGHGHASVHNSDPPLHGHLRNIVLPALSRTSVMRREARFAEIADTLVASAPRGEPFDFVEAVAITLPMLVIAEMLGVPEADATRLVKWANLMSDVRAGNDEQASARSALFDYFRWLTDERRANPANDVASALVASDLSDSALDAYFMLLTVAGNETTRFLLTGGLAQLLRQPDEMAQLRTNPALIGPMVEEMCRFVSPVIHMRRTTAEATDLYGTPVPAGAKVVLWFASANRDDRVFTNPDQLTIERSPNPHVGFGMGAHFCVGAHLARLESRLFFDALLKRTSQIELVGEPERLPSNWFTGWTSMKVAWS
jgi:cytochrome P450